MRPHQQPSKWGSYPSLSSAFCPQAYYSVRSLKQTRCAACLLYWLIVASPSARVLDTYGLLAACTSLPVSPSTHNLYNYTWLSSPLPLTAPLYALRLQDASVIHARLRVFGGAATAEPEDLSVRLIFCFLLRVSSAHVTFIRCHCLISNTRTPAITVFPNTVRTHWQSVPRPSPRS